MHPQYASIGELILALEHNLLTPEEARVVALDYFPGAKKLQDAQRLVAAAASPTTVEQS